MNVSFFRYHTDHDDLAPARLQPSNSTEAQRAKFIGKIWELRKKMLDDDGVKEAK